MKTAKTEVSGRPRGATLPKLRKHVHGQAVVRIAGRDHYLGRHGTRSENVPAKALLRRAVRALLLG